MPKGEKKAGGRPKTVRIYSDKVKKNYLAAAKKIERETGQTIEERYLRMSIDAKVQSAARAAFAKLYNEALLIKQSEQTINDKREGPTIGLPPTQPKPHVPKEAQEEKTLHG